jgi:hypothetical protein
MKARDSVLDRLFDCLTSIGKHALPHKTINLREGVLINSDRDFRSSHQYDRTSHHALTQGFVLPIAERTVGNALSDRPRARVGRAVALLLFGPLKIITGCDRTGRYPR